MRLAAILKMVAKGADGGDRPHGQKDVGGDAIKSPPQEFCCVMSFLKQYHRIWNYDSTIGRYLLTVAAYFFKHRHLFHISHPGLTF